MQTYTHLLLGSVLARVLFPDQPAAQVACLAGSILPDIVLMPKFALDKIRGKQALAEQGKHLLLIKNIINSWVLWGLFLSWVGFFLSLEWNNFFGILLVAAVALGGFVHVIVDAFTRKDKRFRETDPTFIWPFQDNLWKIGLWEYRYDHGILKPKPLELAIDIALIIFLVWVWIFI